MPARTRNGGLKPGLGIGEWAVFLPAIKDAVAAAQNELIGDLIRKSNARRKIVPVGRDESATNRYAEW